MILTPWLCTFWLAATLMASIKFFHAPLSTLLLIESLALMCLLGVSRSCFTLFSSMALFLIVLTFLASAAALGLALLVSSIRYTTPSLVSGLSILC